MLRTWNFRIQLERPSDIPIYLQLARRIAQDIVSGRLLPGTAMPGSRDLADSLDVNRKTVVLAYDELIAQGWLVTENRRGTFVSAQPPLGALLQRGTGDSREMAPGNMDAPPARVKPIDFSNAQPDPRLIPYETVARAFRKSLVQCTRNPLEQPSPTGRAELREAIAAMLNMEKGLRIRAGNVCVVRSSQMGMFIALRVLTRPDDCVIVEKLTYASVRETLRASGARILHAGVDAQGVDVDEIERLCMAYPVRAVYVTPQHQFPTTVRLSDERRRKLLRLAEKHDFILIEDDHDYVFDNARQAPLPLASMDTSGRVIYIGSLSKIFAPALQVGYVVGPAEFVQRCAGKMMLIDQHGNPATELAMADLMHSGELQRHALKMSRMYSERRQVLSEMIGNKLGANAHCSTPTGGLAFWVRFRDGIEMPRLLGKLGESNIRLLPGSAFAEANSEVNAVRMSFANLTTSEFAEGLTRLAEILAMLI